MLNSMRMNVKKLSWILWLVILSFIATIFFVWGVGSNDEKSGLYVAKVNGEFLTREQFATALQSYTQYFRRIYGERFEQISDSLNLETIALNGIIEETVIRQQAQELGINVSTARVQREIATSPEFQVNGRFSIKRYRTLLGYQRQIPADYEMSVRHRLIGERMRQVIRGLPQVGAKEVEDLYRLRNDSLEIEAFLLSATRFFDDIELDPSEVESYWEEHKALFQVGETVRANYVFIPRATLEEGLEIADSEVDSYYTEQRDSQFKQEEKVRARHILFRVSEDAPDAAAAAVQDKAQALYEELQAGKDFATVANELTEDPSGKGKGGDLGWFGRGQMVPAFENVAFSLKPGELSIPVRTRFGYHLIKVEEHQDAGYKPIKDVSAEIRSTLRRSKAQELAKNIAQTVRRDLLSGMSCAEVAQNNKLPHGTTEPFEISAEIPGIGRVPAFNRVLFALEPDGVSESLSGESGDYLFRLLERRPQHEGTFEEVKERAETALRQEKAEKLAQIQVQEVRKELAHKPFLEMAKQRKLDLKTSKNFRRSGFLPGIGRLPEEVETALFAAKAKEVLGPVMTDQGNAFIRVVASHPADLADLDEKREKLEEELLAQKRNALFQTWLKSAKDNADIEVLMEVGDRQTGQPPFPRPFGQ